MIIFTLPLVGQLSLSGVLASLVIAFLVLILLEKRNEIKQYILGKSFLQNSSCLNLLLSDNDTSKNGKLSSESSQFIIAGDAAVTAVKGVTEPQTDTVASHVRSDDKSQVVKQEETSTRESTSCSSSSEEETENSKKGVSKRKHSCKGAKACSKKKKVSSISIVMDDNDDELKVDLENLISKFETGDVTCTIAPLPDKHFTVINSEESPLSLFVVTSAKSSERLHHVLWEMGEKDNQRMQTFNYCIAGLIDEDREEVMECSGKLQKLLSDVGGVEWLPLTYISQTEHLDDTRIVSSSQYINKVLKKAKKSSKSCCGTSCGSKAAVDIEDLAASFLPVVTPVST